MGESYYELLGVDTAATTEEVAAAYREKVKKSHPDVSDDSDAQERTKSLIRAKEVLTDEAERDRYDRLGHEQYVDATASTNGASGYSNESEEPKPSTTPGKSEQSAGTTEQSQARESDDRQTSGGGSVGTSAGKASWYGGTRRKRKAVNNQSSPTATNARTASPGGRDDDWRAWNPSGAYWVNPGQSRRGIIGEWDFSSREQLGLLVVTFVVYPILLFGALFPEFPLLLRGIVAICILLTVAFVQSYPQVGVAVFGAWSILLPIGLFVSTIPLFSVAGLIALTAVVFPFGLSLLTRVVIRPTYN